MIWQLQIGHSFSPKVGRLRDLSTDCTHLVPFTPYSRAWSHSFLQDVVCAITAAECTDIILLAHAGMCTHAQYTLGIGSLHAAWYRQLLSVLRSSVFAACIHTDKLLRPKQTIQQWQGKNSCKKRDLLSLIGLLSHACRVIRAGRTFLRRMIDISSVPKELNH